MRRGMISVRDYFKFDELGTNLRDEILAGRIREVPAGLRILFILSVLYYLFGA